MVNTQPPPIKEAGYPMNLGHDNVGWVAAGGNIFRLVFEADSRETVVGSPAIGSNRCSRAHSRLDERNEALGGCVLDTRHADTTGAPTPDFGGNRDNRFLVCFPPRNANLPAAHIGFVDLDLAIQKLSARSNHGPAQLMEPCPSRLITAQAEYSLNPKRTDAVLLIRHIPHRLEPKPQRFPRTLEDRPRGRRRLTLASRTSLLAPGRHPRLGSPAGRTPKPGRPTDTPKKIRTGGLRSEPVVKFHKRARVIDPANGMGSILGHHNILPLRERIGYPISGILPGYVAGHYEFDEAHIDLRPLCQFAGARLYHDEAIFLDLSAKQVVCKGRPAVPYDVLSVNIGSTPSFAGVSGAEKFTTPVKPIDSFIDRWQQLAERVLGSPDRHHIGVVGAGAGGIELLLAIQFRLGKLLAKYGQAADRLQFHLISKSESILPDFATALQRRFDRLLLARGVNIYTSAPAENVAPGKITVAGGETIELDEIIWVTAAGAPSWLRDSGLDVDESGFIQVHDTLQSTSHADVFAAGDIAAVVKHPRPKAGVFAVRQGPPLTKNLRRILVGQPARPFSPQRAFLTLISTGDKYAVADKWGLSAGGRLLWRWKDWIDRRFMHKFSEVPKMPLVKATPLTPGLADPATLNEISANTIRCGGCGAKVGASVLTRALADLEPVANSDVLVGLHAADDAAVVQIPNGKVMVHTVDYFRAFIDDAYVFGQVAANHALSDIFAMGAEAQSALAIATVPYGLEVNSPLTKSSLDEVGMV